MFENHCSKDHQFHVIILFIIYTVLQVIAYALQVFLRCETILNKFLALHLLIVF